MTFTVREGPVGNEGAAKKLHSKVKKTEKPIEKPKEKKEK